MIHAAKAGDWDLYHATKGTGKWDHHAKKDAENKLHGSLIADKKNIRHAIKAGDWDNWHATKDGHKWDTHALKAAEEKLSHHGDLTHAKSADWDHYFATKPAKADLGDNTKTWSPVALSTAAPVAAATAPVSGLTIILL